MDIYVKYEGLNPTGSFKDRGMTMAVTKAVEEGSNAIICASTGNTSAAAAAYAARAGITAFVIIPEGKIAMGKLAQAMMYGAVIMQIRGNFDQGMELVKQVAEKAPVTIVNSVTPSACRVENRGLRNHRRARPCPGLPLPAGGQRGQHRPLDRLLRILVHEADIVTEACAFCEGHCRYAGGR